MKFKVKAENSSGERFEEVKQAQDKVSLYQELKGAGNTVISIEEISPSAFSVFLSKLQSINIGGVKTRDKIMFAKNLGAMIEAGLPLTRALNVLERQSKGGKLKTVLSGLLADVNKGETLSHSMEKFPKTFPNLFVSMVKAGEESGNLSQSLSTIALQLEKSHNLYKKVMGAMIYPAIVLVVMISIGILMLVFLVPVLTETFQELELELPLSTRIIIFSSDFLVNNYILSGLAFFFLAGLTYFGIRTKKGKRFINFLTLHAPVISGIIKQSNSARTARTLSSLLSSGVDFLIAIKITEEVVQNSYYKEILLEAENSVEKGETISKIFLENEHLYPPFVGEMVSIGEETGKLSSMLLNVAEYYEDEIDQKTKNISSIIDPILMIIIGIGVGIFAVSMLMPIYSMVDAI